MMKFIKCINAAFKTINFRRPAERKWLAEIQTDTDDLVSKSTVAVQTFSEEPHNSTTEKDETDSNLNSTMKDFKAVNWE